MNEWKELKQALPINDGWVKCGPRYVDANAVHAINEGGSMKADEIRKIADASNRGLREISRKFSAQEVQAEAVIHAAQWLAEIAAQLAEMNERAEVARVQAVEDDELDYGCYRPTDGSQSIKRDCDGDGHSLCRSCARRTDRDVR